MDINHVLKFSFAQNTNMSTFFNLIINFTCYLLIVRNLKLYVEYCVFSFKTTAFKRYCWVNSGFILINLISIEVELSHVYLFIILLWGVFTICWYHKFYRKCLPCPKRRKQKQSTGIKKVRQHETIECFDF